MQPGDEEELRRGAQLDERWKAGADGVVQLKLVAVAEHLTDMAEAVQRHEHGTQPTPATPHLQQHHLVDQQNVVAELRLT